MALIKIADTHADCRSEIGSKLLQLAQDPSWQMLEQLKGTGASIRRSDGLMRLHIAHALDRWNMKHSIAETAARLPLESHEKFLWQNYKR